MADAIPLAINIEHHLMSFVEAFVIGPKKDRWKLLLAKRGKNTFRDSHKLQAALDVRYCARTQETDHPTAATMGVFFDFHIEPVVITEAEANQRCGYPHSRDAVFSIVAGQLAYYFFHEGACW